MISVKLGIKWADSGAFHLLHKDPLCQESQRTMWKGGNKVKGSEAVSRVDLPVNHTGQGQDELAPSQPSSPCVVLGLQPTPGVGNAVAGYAARFSTTKRAEPKGSNPRPVGKVRCHLGLGKQVEKGDQKVGSVITV